MVARLPIGLSSSCAVLFEHDTHQEKRTGVIPGYDQMHRLIMGHPLLELYQSYLKMEL